MLKSVDYSTDDWSESPRLLLDKKQLERKTTFKLNSASSNKNFSSTLEAAARIHYT